MEYMDQVKQHNIQTLGQFSQFHFSKKCIQILVSISAFSILMLPLFSHCISAFTMQLVSYTTDRNCIFLFCNGILVFLIRNSGLAGTSPLGSDTNHERVKQNVDPQPSVPELAENRAVAREEAVEVEDNEFFTTKDEDEDEDEEEEEKFVIIEGEEEEGMGLLSAEELNKKCEDFIRKMREGIKIEAQQVIMV